MRRRPLAWAVPYGLLLYAVMYGLVLPVRFERAWRWDGAISAMDILATLYFGVLTYDPKRPDWAERDRFVMS